MCKRKCRLDASVCNNKQRWNDDKSRCECKELIDKGVSDKGSIWNHSNCECECDKSGDVGKYLDYENCKFRKKFIHKLIEECPENAEEAKLAKITSMELHTVHYVVFNNLYNQHWNCYLVFYYIIKNMLQDTLISIKQQVININGRHQTN